VSAERVSVRQQDREQADCKERAGRGQSVRAAHPLDDPCGRNLRDDDEEGVDEEDDADLRPARQACAPLKRRRMLEKNAPPIITSTMLAAIRMRKSRS